MSPYITEQERLKARIKLALQPHGIETAHALSILSQATMMRLNSQATPISLSPTEKARRVIELLNLPHAEQSVASERLSQLMPVMGMEEFATLLELTAV